MEHLNPFVAPKSFTTLTSSNFPSKRSCNCKGVTGGSFRRRKVHRYRSIRHADRARNEWENNGTGKPGEPVKITTE